MKRTSGTCRRVFSGDPEGKVSLLLDHAGRGGNVADPWYTGDFEATWRDVNDGCRALLRELSWMLCLLDYVYLIMATD